MGCNGYPVEVDGVAYPSARQAAEHLGMKPATVQARAHSANFPTYRWLPKHAPEDRAIARALIEPEPWPFSGDLARRASVMDPNVEPPRVVRRVGYVRCLRCSRPHFSEDVVSIRLCLSCGGLGGRPVGRLDDEDD
ncbi:MAG: hypothetical protein WCY60_04025 [Trueperaceae bacterium]